LPLPCLPFISECGGLPPRHRREAAGLCCRCLRVQTRPLAGKRPPSSLRCLQRRPCSAGVLAGTAARSPRGGGPLLPVPLRRDLPSRRQRAWRGLSMWPGGRGGPRRVGRGALARPFPPGSGSSSSCAGGHHVQAKEQLGVDRWVVLWYEPPLPSGWGDVGASPWAAVPGFCFRWGAFACDRPWGRSVGTCVGMGQPGRQVVIWGEDGRGQREDAPRLWVSARRPHGARARTEGDGGDAR
jgi:hypothetical protein